VRAKVYARFRRISPGKEAVVDNKQNTDSDSEFSKSRVPVKLILLILLLGAVVAGLWLLPVKSYLISTLEWTKGLGMWGPVFVILFYIIACVLFLPGSVITLGAGFLFGVPMGLASCWIGATLGACAAFLVGRTVARDWVVGKVRGYPKFAAVDAAVGREGFKITALLRLSPVFPFNFLNYALGLTKVSFKDYALATALGILPGGLMYVYFGSAARSLADVAAGNVERGRADQVFFWFGLGATILVAALVTRVARKSLREAEAGGPLSDGNS
jgi:uncharacterized membrane protein YdjX (TVP38/TMEM64 family)